MANKVLKILFSVLLTAALALEVTAQEREQTVGVVLSGGGARGIAHVGLLQALEDNDIPIDYVAGTSMGSIVSGLYACGYTPAQMMELFNSTYFLDLSTGTVDPVLRYRFTSPEASPQMFAFPLGKTPVSVNKFNPQSLINPMPMDYAFMELFSAYTAQCDSNFNNLFVPFRCVASNVKGRHKQVFSGGSIGHSIRASMSFPLVYQATMIDSMILYDGGVYDNFPVDVMVRDFAPDIMIGSVVHGKLEENLNSYMSQLELLVTAPQSYDLPAEDGIKLNIDVGAFSLFDFPQAQQIYQVGYNTALEMMDSIKLRVRSRIPAEARTLRREIFKSRTPYLRFDRVYANGGTPNQNAYLEYLFTPRHHSDTLGTIDARHAFYRAVSTGKYSLLDPRAHYNDSTGLFSLEIKTGVKPALSGAVGGYITSTNNSFLYLRLDHRPLSFHALNSKIEAWLGQSYMAGHLGADFFLHTRIPSAVTFSAVASRRRYNRTDSWFFSKGAPDALSVHSYFGKLGFAIAAGRYGRLEAGVKGGRRYNSYYENFDSPDVEKEHERLGINEGLAFISFNTNTLDNELYPTSGCSVSIEGDAVTGKTHLKRGNPGADEIITKNSYVLAHGNYRQFFKFHRHWSLGVEADLTYNTRSLFPDYNAAVTMTSAFTPTPASDATFRSALRANSYAAVGLVPVYIPISNLSIRVGAYAFQPFKRINQGPDGSARYGNWFGARAFYGELCANYRLPFANVNAYCNYDSTHGRWGAGLSLGFYILAPKFL